MPLRKRKGLSNASGMSGWSGPSYATGSASHHKLRFYERRKKHEINTKEGKASKAAAEKKEVPHVLVFLRSKATPGKSVARLVKEWQHVFSPYTTRGFEVAKKATLKHIVKTCREESVSHLLAFGRGDGAKCKMVRMPRGPSLCWKIPEYSLMSDVQKFMQVAGLKYDTSFKNLYSTPPFPVFEGFDEVEGAEGMEWVNLAKVTIENMFLKIDPEKEKHVRKRCVLFAFDKETQNVYVRHYSIKEEDKVVELSELGPRMTLKIEKILDGVLDGEVLHHAYVSKTVDDMAKLKKQHAQKESLRLSRKAAQEKNVEKKVQEKKAKKQKRKEKEKEKKLLIHKRTQEEVAEEDKEHVGVDLKTKKEKEEEALAEPPLKKMKQEDGVPIRPTTSSSRRKPQAKPKVSEKKN